MPCCLSSASRAWRPTVGPALPRTLGLMKHPQFWFRSSIFKNEPGEDEETNPLCFGKHLATWLSERLRTEGREVEPTIAEDWGWCVVTQRKPFMLWVGCVSSHDYAKTTPTDPTPRDEDVVWSCFVVSEAPVLSKLWRPPATERAVSELFTQVHNIIAAEPQNRFCEQP